MTGFEKLVTSVADTNMNKLQDEVWKFTSLGYKIHGVKGYGEGVFTINILMIHPNFGEVHLAIPQCSEDSELGRVMFNPIGRWDGFKNYEF